MKTFKYLIIYLALLISSGANAESFKSIKAKAVSGDVEAMLQLADAYDKGIRVRVDNKKAATWYKKAAGEKSSVARYKLIYMSIKTGGVNKANENDFDTLQGEAAEGSAEAQYVLGQMYEYGVGFKVKIANAKNWYQRSVNNGSIYASEALVSLDKREADRKKRKQAAAAAKIAKEKADAERKKAAAIAKAKRDTAIAEKKRKDAKLELARKMGAKAKAENDAWIAKKAEEKRRRDITAKKEKERLAKIKARENKAKGDKAFSNDPCSGAAAKFLSTC